MIHFLIKFLICFPKPVAPVKKTNVKKKPLKSQTTSKKKGKSEPVPETEEIPQPRDENIIECTENVRNWCHIEYSLFKDHLPTFEINVVAWGEAAKIYTKDDSRAIKTLVTSDFVWVHFAIAHKILRLENNEILKFKSSKITFTFSQDESKMMSKATNDWPKEFTICKKLDEDTKSPENWFPELYQTNPIDEFHKGSMKERADSFLSSRPDLQTVVSMLQLPSYEEKILTKIYLTTKKLQTENELTVVPQKSAKKKKAKRDSTGRKSQVKADTKNISDKNNNELDLKCELLIAKRRNICVESTNVFPTLKYASVIANASEILSDDQDFTFVPFNVTIEGIEALPEKFLRTLRLQNIFARYELANIVTSVETVKVPVTGTRVTFDDTRVFFLSTVTERIRFPYPQFMHRPSMLVLAEAIMTHNLVVKVFGETDILEDIQIEPCLFGQKPTDHGISTPGHDMFLTWKPPPTLSREVYLGSAGFNLIKLMKGFTCIEDSCVITSKPLTSWDPAFDLEDVLDRTETEEERDALLHFFSTRGRIPEFILQECCTRISITVSIGYPLSNLTEKQLLVMNNVFHRIIVIFKDHTFAINLVEKIKKANSIFNEQTSSLSMSSLTNLSFSNLTSVQLFPQGIGYREPSRSSIPKVVRNTRTKSVVSYSQIWEMQKALSVNNKAITGFFIDHEEESILVVESIPYITPYIVEPLQQLVPSGGRVVFDSSIFFTRRVYGEVYQMNVLTVKLTDSLDSMLKDSAIYLARGTPEPALQTLLLLDLLRRSPSLNCACVNQLFPSSDQIISFNAVFGNSQLCGSESNTTNCTVTS